ncbi:HET-domain-containing protein, partial [Tothia fuscella]
YRYQALESDQHLRLLSVLPFVESGRFMYEMQTFGLDQAPPFESVSYVWGDDKRNYDLAFSDSSVLKITQSLFVALSILSQHCRTGHLWIDQLCIDQSNVQERNHQVKSMGSIYKQAEKVLVFL